MAINFPASPSTNDTFTAGSITYKWDGAKWIGLGVTPADRIVEGSNSLEITAGNDLVWTGDNIGIGISNPSVPLHISGTNGILLDDSTNQKRAELRSKNDVVELNAYDPANTNAPVPIVFKQYTSERLRISSDGNTGIGRSPSYSGIFGGSQRTLHIGGSAAPCLRITSDTASQGDLVIHAGNSGGDSVIGSLAEGGDIVFYTRPTGGSVTESYRITSSGNVKFASGKGIDFSPSSDSTYTIGTPSEVLADYEEGTFSPDIQDTGSSATYTSQNLQYIKTGRMVMITGRVQCTRTGTGGGVLQFRLPFAADNTNSAASSPWMSHGSCFIHDIGVPGDGTGQFFWEINSTTHAGLFYQRNNQSWTSVPTAQIPTGNNGYLTFTMTYRAAA